MTKKDFELIAKVLSALPPHSAEKRALVKAFASALESAEPRFDREKFFNHCGQPTQLRKEEIDQ